MSSEEKAEKIDQVLDLLSKPLSRYILSVLAGIDPGNFRGTPSGQNEDSETEETQE